MPQVITVRVSRPHRRTIRLWIPLVPILLVLLPVLVVATLVATVACLAYRINPIRALGTGWRLLCATRGTRINVEQGRTAVLVGIS